ncbi:MAG: hypothetical protein AAFV95_22140 [Bacteroidota bacterium]
MKKSKIIRILRSFDAAEQLRLTEFLHSPYCFQHPQEEKIQQLLAYILEVLLDEQGAELSKEAAFHRLFPGEAMVKGKVEKLMTTLLQATHAFVLQEEHRRASKTEQQLLLANFFQRKGLDQDFHSSLQKARKAQDQVKVKDRQHYHHSLRIEQVFAHYQGHYNPRHHHLNLLDTLHQLEWYYHIVKLEYSCMLVAQTCNDASLKDLVSEDAISEMTQKIEQLELRQEPLTDAYLSALKLLRQQEESSFHQLSQQLDQYDDSLPNDCRKSLSAVCRNFCVEQYNKGKTHYLDILHQLYQKHLAKGDLHHQGKLLASTFRNMVTMGLRLKKYDWVHQFLQEYRHRIGGTRQAEAIYKFNLANYHFARHQYDEALALLADKQQDIYYRLAAKRLELKIHYELNSPLLAPRMDAFKVYIFRLSKKQLPDVPRQGNNHFVDVLRQICMPRTYRNNSRIDKLSDKLREKKILLEKDWLAEKLEALRQP